ncbi:hypothetical protein Tco_0535188 [Tanacetum coccineum]
MAIRSCIEQFWATVKAKTVNGKVQLQALVDGKKVIITESTIRRELHPKDAEGFDCLPNATIFEQLTLIGSKTTAWNEFISIMASAIICLAINQKFNFSKYIFESMVKNLESVSGKFLMYPRFVQVFLDKQLEGMSNHKRIHVAPSHTKMIFGNMKRVGKGFSRRETPLFPTMMVQAQEEMGEGSAMPTDPHHTPPIIQPSTSQPQKTQKPRKPKRKDTEVPQPSGPTTNVADETVNEEMDDSLERASTTATSLDTKQDRGNINKTRSKATPNEPSSPGTSSSGGPRRQETIGDIIAQTRSENVSKLSNDSLLAGEITSLKRRVKRLEKKGGSRTQGLRRLYKGRIDDIDANGDIYLVNVHKDEDMFGVNDLEGDEVVIETEVDHEVVVETEVASKDADKVVIQEQGTITITTAATIVTAASTRPKAKGFVIHKEEEATAPTVSSQQPLQIKVQDKAEFDEEERLAREKRRENVALTEEWNDIQAKIDAELAIGLKGLHAQEQEEKRWKQESFKKQKVEEDKESKELKQYLEIIPDDGDDVTIDATPLSTKSPSIVDYKIYKEGKKSYFQIIKAEMFNDVEASVRLSSVICIELLILVKKQLMEGYGRIVGIKSLLEVTAAKVCVATAKQNLVLFSNLNEKYAK